MPPIPCSLGIMAHNEAANIGRLLRGEESKIGAGKSGKAASASGLSIHQTKAQAAAKIPTAPRNAAQMMADMGAQVAPKDHKPQRKNKRKK